jgi:hypothetical protein
VPEEHPVVGDDEMKFRGVWTIIRALSLPGKLSSLDHIRLYFNRVKSCISTLEDFLPVPQAYTGKPKYLILVVGVSRIKITSFHAISKIESCSLSAEKGFLKIVLKYS